MTAISLVFSPFLLALAVAASAALATGIGVAIAAVSAASIQIWFRSQAKHKAPALVALAILRSTRMLRPSAS